MTKKDQDTDIEFITALTNLLQENDLTEIQVERDYGGNKSLSVMLSRQTMAAPAPMQAAAPVAAAAIAEQPAAAAPIEDPAQHPGAVTSPMVGTVYLSAEPGAAPFVTVGSSITEGQTVLIIEAMKTMNQIPASKSGTITRILVDDATPVEFGSPLVIIE
ncbi:MAG: acetyl-CoA carboxylase biotin carboxyl carrier protein [Rhodobacterales bacterium]